MHHNLDSDDICGTSNIYRITWTDFLCTRARIGRNGRKFKMYKFRSMYMDAEERKKELMAQNKVSDGMMFKMDFKKWILE